MLSGPKASQAVSALSRRSKKRFVVLDLDRCIADTSKLQSVFELVVEESKVIPPRLMLQARQEVEASGGSFDTASWLRQQLEADGKAERWHSIAEEFIKIARGSGQGKGSDMLMPGADRLMAYLDSRNLSYGFLTFGGRDWQLTKLRATGLEHLPRQIIDFKQKGKLIESWRQPDGSFLVPAELSGVDNGLSVDQLAFLDDKPESFEGLRSADTLQILVTNPGKTPASSLVTYTDNQSPQQVANLGQAISTIDSIWYKY